MRRTELMQRLSKFRSKNLLFCHRTKVQLWHVPHEAYIRAAPLNAGKDNIDIAWWLSLYPGLAILITVLGYNLLGEGIRDSLDPRLK